MPYLDQGQVRQDYSHAISVLENGDLAGGLELCECRWNGLVPKNPIWDSGLPLWEGENIGAGNVLLLHHEQGLGDTIMWSRFIRAIEKRAGGADIAIAVPPPLYRLFENNKEILGLSAVYGDEAEADYHCPLISAVARLRPNYGTLPDAGPYLMASDCEIDFRPGGEKLAVGLCWATAAGPPLGGRKSVALLEMLALTSVPGIKFWSLQFGPRASDIHIHGAGMLISEVPDGVGDLAKTASIISRLDLVISVDTVTAHLAGALGKRVVTLTPIERCWRWTCGPKPWYRSMTLFRQEEPGNWREPLETVKGLLFRLVYNEYSAT